MRWTAGDGSAPVGAGPPRSIVAVEAIPPGKLATPRSGRCPESAGSGRGAGSGTVADATATDAPSSRSENRNSARVSATGIPARIAIRKRRRIIGRNTDHEDSKTLADSSGPCKIQNRASQAVPPRTTLPCLPGQCQDVPNTHGPLPRPPLHVSRERLRSVPHTLFTFVCRICVADRLFSDRGARRRGRHSLQRSSSQITHSASPKATPSTRRMPFGCPVDARMQTATVASRGVDAISSRGVKCR